MKITYISVQLLKTSPGSRIESCFQEFFCLVMTHVLKFGYSIIENHGTIAIIGSSVVQTNIALYTELRLLRLCKI